MLPKQPRIIQQAFFKGNVSGYGLIDCISAKFRGSLLASKAIEGSQKPLSTVAPWGNPV